MTARPCAICGRIERIRRGGEPWLVAELETGYAVLGDRQLFRGYTLLLCKRHASELFELDDAFRARFLEDLNRVARAVFEAFRPRKMNYELLGNVEPHLHWHVFPRHADDPEPNKPVWAVDEARHASRKPDPADLAALKRKLIRP